MSARGLGRSGFLAASVGATFAGAGFGRASLAAAADGTSPQTTSPAGTHFDRKAFEAVLAEPYPHRQVAAATTPVSGGRALHFLKNSLDAYADPDGFDAGPHALKATAVFYGGFSVALALADTMWAAHPIGVIFTGDDGSHRPSAAPTANPHREEVAALVARGATFFVCNNALRGFAEALATRATGTTLTTEALRADLAAHLLPGCMLVPAGVAALNALQEARFTLLPPVG